MLESVAGLTHEGGRPWRDHEIDDDDKACGNEEIEVHVTDEHFENLCALLQFDRRTSRIGGLCLKSDYPPIGIAAQRPYRATACSWL